MGHGLQVFNQYGVEIFNTSATVARLIDVIHTGRNDGVKTYPGHNLVVCVFGGRRFDEHRKEFSPHIVNSGNSVRWSFGSRPWHQRLGEVLYILA